MFETVTVFLYNAPLAVAGEAGNRRQDSAFFDGGAAGTDRAASAQEQVPWRRPGTDRGRVVREIDHQLSLRARASGSNTPTPPHLYQCDSAITILSP